MKNGIQVPHLFTIVLLAFALFIASCKNDSLDEMPNPVTCDTANVSFSAVVLPIMSSNCYNGCHNGSSATAGFRLDSYTAVKAKVDDNRLYGAIAHQAGFSAMPQGRSKLGDCPISQIKAWIDQGAKNN